MGNMASNEVYKNIGKIIRAERNKKGLTLEELGEKVDRDWSYLSQIERGKSVPSIETLARISDALNIPLNSLFKTGNYVSKSKKDPHLEKINYVLKDKNVKYKKIVADFVTRLFK